MPRVFISYRRTDIDANVVGRLDDRMVERWGRKRVFRDIDSIPGGLDFAQHIQNTLSKRPVVLVLIGQTWLKVMNERLDDPQDFVRMEVASSLSEGLKVIPVLVGGAKMPTADELPEGLDKLSSLHAREISENHFTDDVGRLIRDINARTWARVAPILLGIVFVIGVGGLWFWSNHLEKKHPLDEATYTIVTAGGGIKSPWRLNMEENSIAKGTRAITSSTERVERNHR